jgi:hypothetical protein
MVNGVRLLTVDGNGGRWAGGMAEVAGVGVQGSDVGDRLGQALSGGLVGLGGEQREQLDAEASCEPGRAVNASRGEPRRDRSAVDHDHHAGSSGDEVLVAGGVW